MACNHVTDMEEPSIDTDKLSYEIFSVLESKFLFGYDDKKLWIPKQIAPAVEQRKNTSPIRGEGQSVQAIKNQRGKICILSIDGGGMRSILSGKALASLEQALKVKSGNPDARIADYFDVAAGSGVGGIFITMLFSTNDQNCPLFHADDTWKLLADQGKKFYPTRGPNYGGFLRRIFRSTGSATAGLEKSMKEAFVDKAGRSLTLKDTLKPVLIPCYDLCSTAPFLFSRADALETDSFDFRLWEVCRATSAEPGVFEPVFMKSVDGKTKCVAVDGGLAMGNPTAAAITHVLHNKQEFPFVRGVEDILVLSLGTGQLLEGSFKYEQVKNWKAKDWARPMARISGDGSADMVDQSVAMAFGQYRSTNYVRVQEFSHINMKGFSNVSVYCKRLKELADQFKNVGAPVTNDRLVLHMVVSLSEAYNGIGTLLRQSNPLPSFYQVRSMLTLEEVGLAKKAATGVNSIMMMATSDDPHSFSDNSGQNRNNCGGKKGQNKKNGGKNRGGGSGGGRGGGGQPTGPQPWASAQWPWGCASGQWPNFPFSSPGSLPSELGHPADALFAAAPVQAVGWALAFASSGLAAVPTPTDIEVAMHTLGLNHPDVNWYMDTSVTSHMTFAPGFHDGDTSNEM